MSVSNFSSPRIYRFGPIARLIWICCSLIIFCAGVVGALWAGLKLFSTAPAYDSVGLVALPIGLLATGLGLAALVSTVRGRLELYEDRVEYYGILGRRVVRTIDIKETVRPIQQYGHFVITLVLKGSGAKRVRITDFGKMDETLADWLNALPNVEVQADIKRSEYLLANPAFGSNIGEREHAINSDTALLNRLRWPIYGLVLWGLIHPHPYQICLTILVMLPITAVLMVLASRGRWALNVDNTSGKLGLGEVMALGPAAVIGLRAFLDDDVMEWKVPAAWGVVVGLTLLGIVVVIERRFHAKTLLSVGFAFMWYAWGTLMFMNAVWDHSPTTITRVQVLDMQKGDHVDTLHLTRWGLRKDGNEVSVTHATFRKLRKGGEACVYINAGALGWQRYQVDVCSS